MKSSFSYRMIASMIMISLTVFAFGKKGKPVVVKTTVIDGVEVLYREAGKQSAPTLVLLHGERASSEIFVPLMQQLSERYHLIAPDYPNYDRYGQPHSYSYDQMAAMMSAFIGRMSEKVFSLYMVDHGADIGFRIAAGQPERVGSLIIQNGNAYPEGIQAGMSPSESTILPKPQVNPMAEYGVWQTYFRRHQPPTLVLWAKDEPMYDEMGAHAFHKDLKNMDMYVYEAGPWMLETNATDLANRVNRFLLDNK